jgi:hypothetical protein
MLLFALCKFNNDIGPEKFPRFFNQYTFNKGTFPLSSHLIHSRNRHCRQITAMTFLDLLILYLSLGAPFGAYRLVRNGNPLGSNGLFSAILAFLLWPPYAIRSAYRYLVSSDGSTGFAVDGKPDAGFFKTIEDLSDQFSAAAARSHRLIAKRLEHRFERYVELSLALITRSGAKGGQYFDLLTVSGHPSPQVGAANLNRRNRNVIERHLKDARTDLITALGDLSAGRREAKEVVKTIADLLSDNELSAAVSANLNSPREVSNTRLKQWETSEPRHKTI